MIVVLVAALVGTAGCGTRVRTYVVDKERVDQDLTQGNLGYLTGAPSPEELDRERKLTRQTYVAEIELPSRGAGRRILVEETSHEAEQQLIRAPEPEAAEAAPAAAKPTVTTYTVKDNDTLAKIALEVYGTSKRWKEIYEANTDQLKSPDRIYAGQVLVIPQE